MVWYVTREAVMAAQDVKMTAYAAPRIDSAIEQASRNAEGILHWESFAPHLTTYSFDWPGPQVHGSKLYLERFPLIEATEITSGGEAVPLADVAFYPEGSGPYDRLKLHDDGGSWSGGERGQKNIAVTGLWGWSDVQLPAGVLAEDLDASETAVDTGPITGVGVGSIVTVGTERMIVTGRGWLTTGETATLDALDSARALSVVDGTDFAAGERLSIGSERVEIVDIAGNTLTVRRAVDGSVLAAHSGATIYAQRQLTVERGALGSTAAAHTTGDAVTVWQVPGPLSTLVMAYTIDILLQEQSGYARTFSSKEGASELIVRGVNIAQDRARTVMGRYRYRGSR